MSLLKQKMTKIPLIIVLDRRILDIQGKAKGWDSK